MPQLVATSTDANLPMSLGIPAISIPSGLDGGRAHTPDEWIDVERRRARAQMRMRRSRFEREHRRKASIAAFEHLTPLRLAAGREQGGKARAQCGPLRLIHLRGRIDIPQPETRQQLGVEPGFERPQADPRAVGDCRQPVAVQEPRLRCDHRIRGAGQCVPPAIHRECVDQRPV